MKSCKCKYKVRLFYSKGAFLVLLWCLLLSIAFNITIHTIQITIPVRPLSQWYFVPLLLVVSVSATISGLLADAKFGKHRVVRAGFVLLFLSSLVHGVTNVINATVPAVKNCLAVQITSSVTVIFIGVIGIALIVVNILQLGLDQMPDASAPSITSFIAWFVFSFFLGYWSSKVLEHTDCWYKLGLTDSKAVMVSNFIVTLCLSIVLISDFLFAQTWLIIEPKSLQTLKTVYLVLKFAAQHKAPLNRSAFTYWEEDIPSRLDLGKSKYGGPFTTEEVEDVKTILRLLVLSLALAFVAFGMSLDLAIKQMSFDVQFKTMNSCSSRMLKMFTYDDYWCVLIASLVYEFVIYPLARDRLPSILKKIGTVSFVSILLSVFCLIVEVIEDNSAVNQDIFDWLTNVIDAVVKAHLLLVLYTSVIEHIYAQSPFKVREIFVAYMLIVLLTSVMLGKGAGGLHVWRHTPYLARSATSAVCTIAFILYCIVSHWYKRRVRDDIYATQGIIEEVYDRRLRAAQRYM